MALKAFGETSPNPLVGAILVRNGQVVGQGWHHRAGFPHAEIEALRDAGRQGHSSEGATLYVTLEPCSTHGRTPPCTDAIIKSGIARVVAGATDPNPKHQGRGLALLRKAGIRVRTGVLADECAEINHPWNHFIVHRQPFVTLKCAMTLDGKIATSRGESKWITSAASRSYAMKLRQSADAILVGVNTVMADDPSLTIRDVPGTKKSLRRFILDPSGRIPRSVKVLSDAYAHLTTVVVGEETRRADFSPAQTLRLPLDKEGLDLNAFLQQLGEESVTHLLVEGGGEVNAHFLRAGLVSRVVLFYAPKVIGGGDARKAVAGPGIESLAQAIQLKNPTWRRLGPDLVMEAAPCYPTV